MMMEGMGIGDEMRAVGLYRDRLVPDLKPGTELPSLSWEGGSGRLREEVIRMLFTGQEFTAVPSLAPSY